MPVRRSILTLVCTCAVLLPAAALAAGDLKGVVRDAQGQVVAGATVSVRSGSRQTVATTTTDGDGRFSVDSLPDGAFQLVVTKGAFAESVTVVTVRDGAAAAVEVTLQVGGITDAVTVTASRGDVERAGATGQPVNIITGADGVAGTADDGLTVTGETLAQITSRVLGTATSSSLFTAIPGYAAYGARFGLRSGRHEVVVDLENLSDENYRGLSWGMDAPGRGVSLRYGVRF
jgi:hypothetical protein